MAKIDEVRAAMMVAMKAKDKARKDALSLLLSALKAKAIDKRADLTEEEENEVILREIKQAQETLESAAGRGELEEECRLRIAVYTEFAPQQMSEEEIRQTVQNVLRELGLAAPTARDKGKLTMKQLMPLVKGRADGALVNRMVAEFLQ